MLSDGGDMMTLFMGKDKVFWDDMILFFEYNQMN